MLEIENCLDNLAEDLTRFTDELKPDDYTLGYVLVKVNRTEGDKVTCTQCAGGHPYVIMDICENVMKSVQEHLDQYAKEGE